MEPFIYKLGKNVPPDAVFVIVHHSVKILPDDVFCDCDQLMEVTLPEGLAEIGAVAFAGCIMLEQINWPSTLIKIDHDAFASCSSLRKMTLAGGIVTIQVNVFLNCRSLEGVTILSKAFVLEVDSVEVFTCRLVVPDNGTVALTEAEQLIISPERLNYISSPDLLELENATTTIMNGRGG